jgi:tetrapyrrole methylase family protein / MazG family protein
MGTKKVDSIKRSSQGENKLPLDEFRRLVDIIAALRGPGGCPWDKEQTHESMTPYLLEEAYEVCESIRLADAGGLREELGDLLLQIVFHARLAEERGAFSISDVVSGINEKLVRRHPNVFGNVAIDSSAEQTRNWEKIKRTEGKKSALDGVPMAAPALLRAFRIQQKAAAVGFDWERRGQVWEKVREEIAELDEVIGTGDQERIQEEFGDLLFALVNLSRFIGVHPEETLNQAVEKFIRRFRRVETVLKERGTPMENCTLAQMDGVWNEIKHEPDPTREGS